MNEGRREKNSPFHSMFRYIKLLRYNSVSSFKLVMELAMASMTKEMSKSWRGCAAIK